MATQTERREATRDALVKAGRAHFARAGYEATHTNEILAAAGVSRGAMYHHFPSKQALFEAVFVAESKAAIAGASAAASHTGSPLENLLSACLAWLACWLAGWLAGSLARWPALAELTCLLRREAIEHVE